jgi:hypothetical protein
MIPEIKFHVAFNPSYGSYDLWIAKRVEGKQQMASPICFYPTPVGEISSPSMKVDEHEIQLLMDALWAAGIRPKTESTIGQIAAISYHLEDMRKLVFGKDK